MTTVPPTIHVTLMQIAHTWAGRSTCSSRAAVGAIIVDDLYRVIASGYNGSPRGFPHCNQIGCTFDSDGHCISSIHAEENAIIQCATSGVSCYGMTMYSTHLPCVRCSLRIAQVGIRNVIYEIEYGNVNDIASVLIVAKIKLWRIKDGLLFPVL